MAEAVLQLMRERKQRGSTPGWRDDDARLVLLIEGGSSRGAQPRRVPPARDRRRHGKATDLHERIHDQSSLQAALRASTAMPVLTGGPIELDGRRFVDAGVSETVPVRTALAQKATHIVALRTRRTDERVSPPSRGERLVLSRWFARHAPGALEPWLRREAARAEEEHLLASHPATLQIRPPVGSVRIGRTERRPRPLRAAVHTGRQAAAGELSDCIRELV